MARGFSEELSMFRPSRGFLTDHLNGFNKRINSVQIRPFEGPQQRTHVGQYEHFDNIGGSLLYRGASFDFEVAMVFELKQ